MKTKFVSNTALYLAGQLVYIGDKQIVTKITRVVEKPLSDKQMDDIIEMNERRTCCCGDKYKREEKNIITYYTSVGVFGEREISAVGEADVTKKIQEEFKRLDYEIEQYTDSIEKIRDLI